MKQRGDEHWHGHREITAAAVAKLFREHAGPDATIRGLREEEYFERLNEGQEYPDRVFGAGVIEDVAGSGVDLPYAGLGPTTHSAYLNGEAQREHYMADPRKSGPENLAINNAYLHSELAEARSAGDLDEEMRHLGAAVHALEDSYSGAHAWRDLSVYDGNPEAQVESLNVFTPIHAVGIEDGQNTHVDEFDKPLADSGPVRAAVEANYRLLAVYEQNRDSDPEQAARESQRVLGPMLQPSPAGVEVNTDPDDGRWQASRDQRLGLEKSSAQQHSLLAGVLEQQQPAPEQVRYGADSGRSYRERQGGARSDRQTERT